MVKQIPNIITVSRLMLLPVIVYLMWYDTVENGWYATGLLVIIGLGDLVDGYLARKLDAVTNTGKIVDPMADKLTILVSTLMLLHLHRLNVIIPILILSREIIVITLRAVAASEGIVIQASNEGKRKTALQMFGIGGLFIYYDFFGASAKYCGTFLLILSVILSWYSAIKYITVFLPHWRKTSSL
ncbi:MAG: CDP-diacylglycerol--glycerol-3-phosphate 3-phosphatidyltransferase [Oligoflexia bacterium]|nr:CDP-diacylglycerol--glycerol-3-phosphate 3-phosphatidyltransferase [Oligoflexia bacterium]